MLLARQRVHAHASVSRTLRCHTRLNAPVQWVEDNVERHVNRLVMVDVVRVVRRLPQTLTHTRVGATVWYGDGTKISRTRVSAATVFHEDCPDPRSHAFRSNSVVWTSRSSAAPWPSRLSELYCADTHGAVSLRRLSRVSTARVSEKQLRMDIEVQRRTLLLKALTASQGFAYREVTERVIVAVVMVTRPAVWQRRASCPRSTSLFPQRATSTSSLWTT